MSRMAHWVVQEVVTEHMLHTVHTLGLQCRYSPTVQVRILTAAYLLL